MLMRLKALANVSIMTTSTAGASAQLKRAATPAGLGERGPYARASGKSAASTATARPNNRECWVAVGVSTESAPASGAAPHRSRHQPQLQAVERQQAGRSRRHIEAGKRCVAENRRHRGEQQHAQERRAL